MTDFKIEFIGGPLDGRWASGDDPGDEFDASPPFGIGEFGRMLRYRSTARPGPHHVVAEFIGYSEEFEDPQGGDEPEDD